jgi:hypothetical protein
MLLNRDIDEIQVDLGVVLHEAVIITRRASRF